MMFACTEAVTTVVEPPVEAPAVVEKTKKEVAADVNTKKSNRGKD